MLGIFLAITAGLGWGIAAVFARLGLRGIKPSTGTLISLVSSVMLVSFTTMIVNFDTIASLSLKAILWFGLIGLITYVIGRQSNFAAIRYIGASRATTIFASAPLFSTAIAIIIIGESMNIPITIGTLSIVAGLYLVTTSG
ncbi:EamA family transporter [Chloroflexota bacterium]